MDQPEDLKYLAGDEEPEEDDESEGDEPGEDDEPEGMTSHPSDLPGE